MAGSAGGSGWGASAVSAFSVGDRVVVGGRHPWASYTGEIRGPWPGSLDWHVALDNGEHIGAFERDLRLLEPSTKEAP